MNSLFTFNVQNFVNESLVKMQSELTKSKNKFTQFGRHSKRNNRLVGQSLNDLQGKLEKLNGKKWASTSTKNVRILNEQIRITEKRMRKLEGLPPNGFIGGIRKAGLTFMTAFPYAGVLGAITGFKELIDLGAGFDNSMSNVKALSGATDEQFKSLRKQAKDLGESTAFSAKQASDGMGFLAQAGFNTNDIMSAMPGTLSLAAASTTDLATTADIASNILSGFGRKASEFGEISDKLATTTAKSNTNLTQLGESLKYSAPSARAAGQSMSEMLAITGKFADMGIQGTLSGTALSAAFSRLQKPTRMAEEAIKRTGLKIRDTKGNIRSMVDIIDDMNKKNLAAGDIIRIFGQEAGSKFIGLVQDGAEPLRKLTKEIENSSGAAKKMADIKLDNLGGDITKLKSKFQGFVLTIYDSVMPVFRKITQFITKLVGAFGKVWDALSPLGQAFTVLATSLGLVSNTGGDTMGILDSLVWIVESLAVGVEILATGLGVLIEWLSPVAPLILGVIGVIKALTIAQWAWNLVLSANPIGLVIAAIAVVIGLIVMCWQKLEKFRAIVYTVWDTIKGFGVAIYDYLVAPFKAAWEFIKGIGNALATLWGGGSLEDAGNEVAKGFSKGVEKGVGSIQESINGVVETTTGIGENYDKHLAEETAKQKKKETSKTKEKGIDSLVKGQPKQQLRPHQPTLYKETNISQMSDSITSGGKKQTNIIFENVTLGQDMTIVSQNLEQGADEMQSIITRTLLQVLNSTNGLKTV